MTGAVGVAPLAEGAAAAAAALDAAAAAEPAGSVGREHAVTNTRVMADSRGRVPFMVAVRPG